MANVLAVQTAGPDLASEPAWGDYSNPPSGTKTVQIYTYHTPTDSANGLPGQVKTQTVPGVGGTGQDQVTTYYYKDSSGIYHDSPVEVDLNGNASYTTYDAMDRVLSTTDEDGLTVSYTYDGLGRQLTTNYGNGIYTQKSYGCCTLDWIQDENDHKTHFEYDEANRVTKM